MDQIIASKEIQIERKRVIIEACENSRGNFLRCIEDSHGRRNTIIIPGTGITEFTAAIDEVLQLAEDATPA